MRYREWLFLLLICGIGTGLANWVGAGINFSKSLPGLIVLISISFLSIVLFNTIPIKLPIIAYCSLLGLISAAPFSPIHTFVIQSADIIAFSAPFTIVGSFAGIAIGDKVQQFVGQGWKYIIVGAFVMTGTFLGSCLWDSLTLNITHLL